MKEYYYNLGYDPRKTLMLFYDETVNRFFEVGYSQEGAFLGFLDPVHNIHQILEPWKILLFKEQGWCIFPDRAQSFLVELVWIPF